LKEAPFALLTESEPLLSSGFAGVRRPRDFDEAIAAAVACVVIDANLPESEKARIEALCLAHGAPALYWRISPRWSEGARHALARLTQGLGVSAAGSASPSLSREAFEKIELQALLDIITTANSLLEPKEVMDAVMTRIHGLIPCDAWSVLILEDHDEPVLVFAAAHGPNKQGLENVKVPLGKGIAGWVAECRQPLIVNDARNDSRFMAEVDRNSGFLTRNILCAPLVSRGRVIGAIEMLNRQDEAGFAQQDLELLQTLVNPAAVAIENAYLFQKAQRLTIQDDLTKLYNARHLNHCLDVEIKRAMRGRRPLSLIFLDLDGFKAVNDSFGHLEGSKALVGIGRIIAHCARETDIVGRYGGDEFVLILPDTDTEGAVRLGERIRDEVAAYDMRGKKVTASIGIATYPRHGQDKDVLFRQADQAMYRVKEKGKNGILIAHEL